MNIKNLFTDDDAVSPVIGVILMVAITVILAAVIGAFVLDLGGSQEKTPQTSFDADWNQSDATADNHNVKITQESGDSISVDRLSISGDNVNTGWQNLDSNSKTRAGSYIGAAVEDEVRVIWSSESGETSSTLATFENPN